MALQASVRSNLYKDSVALMRIAEEVRAATGVARATLLMGTEANKAILEQAGLFSDALRAARAAEPEVVAHAGMPELGERLGQMSVTAGRITRGRPLSAG